MRRATAKTSETTTVADHVPFWYVLGLTLLGSVVLWLAFPPVGWWPLAWLAPLPWLYLAAQARPLGRWEYVAIWLGSCGFWLPLLAGIRLAHPALIVGWIVLSAYVAVYLPLAIGAIRVLVQRGRWPLVVAAPVVWIALEYVRSYMATGFSLAMLSQSQTPWPLILQMADLGGAYVPCLLMVLVTAAITLWMVPTGPRTRWIGMATASLAFLAAFSYGVWRLNQATISDTRVARVALVQGCVDTVLDNNPDRASAMITHYRDLTFNELAGQAPCDLVVWPESAFAMPEHHAADVQHLPAAYAEEDYHYGRRRLREVLTSYTDQLNVGQAGRTQFLVGGNTLEFGPAGMQVYNAAWLISPRGEIDSRYFKTHLVMFGEYIPLGEWLPVIYSLAPIQPVSRGREFRSFTSAGLVFAPNICFESTVPQLFPRQINQLAAKGCEPDVLINTTNDGWFYGSAILDLHFQCAVLRAIENRKPFLVAANTGVSGVIDGNGRVQRRGPTYGSEVIVADVQADGRRALFHTVGDWPAAACLLATVLGLLRVRYLSRRH